MVRQMLIGAALAAALCSGIPAAAAAQPPSPPQVVHKIDNGVRRAVTNTDRAVRRAVHRTRHHAPRATHRTVRTAHTTVRARCNDGRIHAGRTRFTACAGHSGLR